MKTRILDWLFGIENTAEVLDFSIAFNFGVPAWIIAFLIIFIGIYCYKIYKREAPDMHQGYRGLLAFLRFTTYVF